MLEKRNSSKDDKNTLMGRHEHFFPQKHTTFKILFVYQLYQKQGVSSRGCFQYNGWGFNKSHIKFFPKSCWRGTTSWLTREALYGINYMCHSTQSCKSSLRVAHRGRSSVRVICSAGVWEFCQPHPPGGSAEMPPASLCVCYLKASGSTETDFKTEKTLSHVCRPITNQLITAVKVQSLLSYFLVAYH